MQTHLVEVHKKETAFITGIPADKNGRRVLDLGYAKGRARR
jgi:hypothetical protein